MDYEQIKAMKTDELYQELAGRRRHLFDLRSQEVTEKLEDPTQLGKTRKQIARILTVLRQRGETNVEQKESSLFAKAARG